MCSNSTFLEYVDTTTLSSKTKNDTVKTIEKIIRGKVKANNDTPEAKIAVSSLLAHQPLKP